MFFQKKLLETNHGLRRRRGAQQDSPAAALGQQRIRVAGVEHAASGIPDLRDASCDRMVCGDAIRPGQIEGGHVVHRGGVARVVLHHRLDRADHLEKLRERWKPLCHPILLGGKHKEAASALDKVSHGR